MGIVEAVISGLIVSIVSGFGAIIIKSKFFSELPLTSCRLDDQGKLYGEAIKQIINNSKRPNEVVFIQHSGHIVQREICDLLKSGINVKLYQQSPSTGIISKSVSMKERINRLPKDIKIVEENTNFKGKLTIRRFRTPASLRAIFVEDKFIILSWYSYYNNGQLRIVGSENPGILVKKGSPKFMELKEMISKAMISHDAESYTNDPQHLSMNITIYE
jgi:hypothetical protein